MSRPTRHLLPRLGPAPSLLSLVLIALSASAAWASHPGPDPAPWSAMLPQAPDGEAEAGGIGRPSPPMPPANVTAVDTPDDAGRSLTITWAPAPHDSLGPALVGYEIRRAEGAGAAPSDTGTFAGEAPPAATSFVDAGRDDEGLAAPRDGRDYRYRVLALHEGGAAVSSWSEPARSRPALFHSRRRVAFAVLAGIAALLLGFTRLAARGRPMFVRKIPGLSAMEEAVGRATEMGRPVLFVPGTQDLSDIQTIYAMVILHWVAKTVARYGTPLIVPVGKAFALPLAEEAVRQGYADAGRPEAFEPHNIRYLTDEQFAFAAAVDGIMLREAPAANLLLGSFFAESLIMAETGNATGAIQIAGTANIHQLPFFVVACDYTLIGEEFFAATAYLSREPALLGALKATDVVKAALIALVLIGTFLISARIVPDLATHFVVQ